MNELIQQARELCEKATPGPWKVVNGKSFGVQSENKNVAGCFRRENEEFIAASRTLVPQLCDALEEEISRRYQAECNYDHWKAQAEKAEAESRWISVSERLPEPGERVLICFDGGFVCEGYHKGLAWDRYENPLGTIEEWMGASVTHWRPLPEPPKEGE